MRFLSPCLFLSFAFITVFSCNEPIKEPNVSNNLDTVISIGKNPYTTMDQSPMDMIYLPDDYPVRRMQLPKTNSSPAPVARVIYSRPHKKGRPIFGSDSTNLCPYGKEWRLGANEATEITFYMTVNIDGKNIGPGVYSMFCIPAADSWEIIFNSDTNIWGLNRSQDKDLFKVQIPTKIQSPSIEDFTMKFQETSDGGSLLMAWDDVKVELPIVYMH